MSVAGISAIGVATIRVAASVTRIVRIVAAGIAITVIAAPVTRIRISSRSGA
jgi:hypothetical protein